jgi:hypothetical protein
VINNYQSLGRILHNSLKKFRDIRESYGGEFQESEREDFVDTDLIVQGQ